MNWKVILLVCVAVTIFIFLQKRSSSSRVIPIATPSSTTSINNTKQTIVKPVSGGNTFEVVVDQHPSIAGAIYYAVASPQENDLTGNTLTPGYHAYEYLFDAAYSVGKPITNFPSPAKINMSYTSSDVEYLDVQSLKIYEWNKAARYWKPLKSVLDTQARKISASISGPGIFSLRGDPKLAKPLITSISPAKISKTNQNIIITIKGKNFTKELGKVGLSGTRMAYWGAIDYKVISPDEVKATFPSDISNDPWSYDLIIENIDGQETELSKAFKVN